MTDIRVGDAVALTPTATLPLYVIGTTDRGKVLVLMPDGSQKWYAEKRLRPFTLEVTR